MPLTLGLAPVILAGGLLGQWQLDRANAKQDILANYRSAPRFEALPPAAAAERYARVSVAGAFMAERHVLVDNRVFEGRPGVHVLTPFRTGDGNVLLVNRGWLSMPADRRSLPPVPEVTAPQRIRGRLDQLPRPGRMLGGRDVLEGDRWPKLVTYPELAAIEAAVGESLYPLVLLLDRDSPGGLGDRKWQPLVMPPERHRAYAFQWFALAAAAFGIWMLLGFRRGHTLRLEAES